MTTIQPFTCWTRKHFRDLRLGLFLHYVYFGAEREYGWGPLGRHHDGPTSTLDALADGLDVEDIARSAETMGAEYVIFTAWHADMNVLYPSQAMARWRPGHASRRDVIAELIEALHARGIELMLYVHPSDGHDFVDSEAAALGWHEPPYTRWHAFITDVFEELTRRYAGQLLGYWFDGGTPPQIDSALDGLYTAIKDIDPGITVVQNEGLEENYFRRWADAGCREWINPPYPSTDMQAAAVITGAWWAHGSLLLWTPELAYHYLVLQAATTGQCGGGVAYSTGPYTGGQWEPGVPAFFATLGNYARAAGESLFGTVPSAAFPTPPGMSVLCLPFAATDAADGTASYLHVLRPPNARELRLPLPANGRRYARATLRRTCREIALRQEPDALLLQLPTDLWWEPLDTIIELTK